MQETSYIPIDSADLYLVYFEPKNGLVKSVIRKRGNGLFSEDTVEELSSTVMFRFIENDLLSRFDSKKISSFGSFVYNIVVNVVIDHYRALKASGESISPTDCGDLEVEYGFDSPHTVAVEASQQTAVEHVEMIGHMETFVSRCSRLNRHKRDRSLVSVLDLTRQGETLETIASNVGVSFATIRNYLAYIAGGTRAESSGIAAQYAGTSVHSARVRREMSARDLAELVRSHSGYSFRVVNADGKDSFPMFVTLRRGWHFIQFGDDDSYVVDLSIYTGETRGLKFLTMEGRVIKVRHIATDEDTKVVRFSEESKLASR